MLQIKKCWDIRDHCHYPGEYRGVGHDISNFKDSLPKEISIILDNGSNYDYHFIIEEIAEEFGKQVTCLAKNSQIKLLKKVTRTDKNGEELTKNNSYILQFIDSARFMTRKLSNLVNHLDGGIPRNKFKYGYDNENLNMDN